MSSPNSDLMGNPITEPIMDDEPEVEVSVVDDRPEGDQKPPSYSKNFDVDEEAARVGKSAQDRISKIKFEYHEQRRNAEAAQRMRDEAVNFADGLARENRDLKELLHRGEKVLLSEMKVRADSELDKARNEYKTAYDAGDTDALLKAQESLCGPMPMGSTGSPTPPTT